MLAVVVASGDDRQSIIQRAIDRLRISYSRRNAVSYRELGRDRLIDIMTSVRMFGEPELHVLSVDSEKKDRDDVFDVVRANPLPHDHVLVIVPSLLKKEKDACVRQAIPVIEYDTKTKSPDDTFSIVRAYERGGKKDVWIAYQSLVRESVAPEAIAGVLFWKLKTESLQGNRNSIESLMQLTRIVHESRKTGASLAVRLEHFVLNMPKYRV